MMQIGLIGIGAGAAAALLFASVATGSLLSVLLFYLAPLPVLIAVLGWTHWAGLIAALGGALALTAVFGGVFFFGFLASAGLPAWWLGYLAMLARPAAATSGNGHTDPAAAMEWYPPGRLVVWAAVLGALIVIIAIPNFGTNAESFHTGLQNALDQIFHLGASATPTIPGTPDSNRVVDFLIIAIPPAAAVLATLTNVFNLWLAGRIVKFSGSLRRPWPALETMTFPPLVAAALGIAILLSFTGGLAGIAAGVVAAALTMAYGVLGFAVLHAITRGIDSRPFLLGGVYAAVMVFGWPVLTLCALGLAEAAFNVRARIARRRGPPART
jgi:hypothetical protein